MGTDKRIAYLDSISGLFIIIMLLWHYNITSSQVHSLENFFYFFLPWFYFKSGMLFQGQVINSLSVMKWVKKLLYPYVVYTAWGGVIAVIVAWCDGGLDLFHICGTVLWQSLYLGSCWYNKPVWFLMTLFLCKCICSYGINKIKPIYLITIALSIACLHSALFNERLNWIGNTSFAIIFYLSGYLLKEIQWRSYIWIPCTIIYICVFLFIPVNIDARSNVLYYGIYPMGVLSAILGCISINNIFSRTNIATVKSMAWIGRNSLLIMVFHYPLISPIRSLVSCFCDIEPIQKYLVAFIVSFLTIFYIKLFNLAIVLRN